MVKLTVIASVPSKTVFVDGNQQAGWLPSPTAQPVDKSLHEVGFTFELQFYGSGYLLCYSSSDGAFYGDTWHETQFEAEQVALEDFGVEVHEWQRPWPFSAADR